jgi:hypothetical protein
MKVKEMAIWKWLCTLDSDHDRIVYIAQCLDQNHAADNIFWRVFDKHKLNAQNAAVAAKKILDLLPEFETEE